MTTTQEREQAFILLFEKSFNPDATCEELISLAKENEVIKDTSYTTALFIKTCDNIDEIDASVREYSKGRSFSRISKVSLAVLRLAVCEIKYFDKVPVGVTINEAVNLCKKYASDDEYTFVNGILGSYAKSLNL